MFQSCRIRFSLKSNHEVRMSVTERRVLPAVRQCLVVSLRLRLAWLRCRRLRVVRWLPGYLLQLVGSKIRIFLLQKFCHVHFCLWMWCNLRWLLILVGHFCRRYILLRQHQFFSWAILLILLVEWLQRLSENGLMQGCLLRRRRLHGSQ